MEPEHSELSIARQCEFLGLARSTFYSSPARESEENLRLMRLLDEQYLRTPFYGSRRMALWLSGQGRSQISIAIKEPGDRRRTLRRES